MLQNIDDQVRDCVQRAAACAERANEVIDPRERKDWLSLQERYLALASGIERSQRRGNVRVFPRYCGVFERPR